MTRLRGIALLRTDKLEVLAMAPTLKDAAA